MPASPLAGGKRRIDRVLAEEFLAGLGGLSMEDLRARRAEADQEEVDLSYVRRMLQGRLDIVTAELSRRDVGGGDVVDRLSEILSDDDSRSPAQGLGRHRSVEPSRVGETRRHEEAMVAGTGTDPTALSDDELRTALGELREEEALVSAQRRLVQDVLDALSAELTSRYRTGSATVDALLEG